MRSTSAVAHGLAYGARQITVLRRVPALELLVLAELSLAARRHVKLLDADERSRLIELARRPRGLSSVERRELRALVAKLELRDFAGSTIELASPVPLPKRLTRLVRGQPSRASRSG